MDCSHSNLSSNVGSEVVDLIDETNKQIVHLNGLIKKMKRNYFQNCKELSKTKRQLEDEKENNDSTNMKLQLNIRILNETILLQTEFNESMSKMLEKTLVSKIKLYKLKERFLTLASAELKMKVDFPEPS